MNTALKPEPPAWVRSERTRDEAYAEIWSSNEKGAGKALDAYFSDDADANTPLVVFQHIRKTGGTSLRHLIYSNRGSASHEVVWVPVKRKGTAAWYRQLLESLGTRRNRIVCAAGHTANFLIPLAGERPVVAFTIVRDPVARAVSHYEFGKQRTWTLEDLYGLGGERPLTKISSFFNGQARSLLAPHHDVRLLPIDASDRDADLWRARLFELVDCYYLIGLQERFLHSVALFAGALGWTELYPATVRVNWTRPREPLDPELVDAIQRYNWLDEELYRRTRDRFEREGPEWEEPESL